MKLAPVIGLEIHIQLKTKTKMFCGCATHSSAKTPNSNVCPVCLGHPGTLPVPNEQAVRWSILTGLALNGTIAQVSKFDRKNYFYPDLPKGYQISQFDMPIMEGGHLDINLPEENRTVRIGITRLHLEEDAAKNIHDPAGKTYVDYNRGGTPLIEIVSEPDIRTPAQAKVFLHELRLIARYLDISNADMEKGHLRCDANISLREVDENEMPINDKLNTKIEIKNLNSFKAVERALEYEIQRQSKLWQAGDPPKVQETRGWNDNKQMTELQRTKEGSADYRYFPDPDLPMLELSDLVAEVRDRIPEMPASRRVRLVDEYQLNPADAKQICEDPVLADYAEQVFSELDAWLNSLPENAGDQDKKKLAKLVSGWLLSKLGGVMKANAIDIRILKVTPENFAELITLLATGKLSGKNGVVVLEEMVASGIDPSHVMEDKKLGRLDDESVIADAVDTVIKNHPDEAARFKAGEKQLLKFFIGMVIKETEGNADPGVVKNILGVKLK
ncbi:MAG: Asp-tRNA(Asn)/Glu-tRNA(Gln) amidotransferase subunit GatB [Candidatus Uhrbacteria bacterium]